MSRSSNKQKSAEHDRWRVVVMHPQPSAIVHAIEEGGALEVVAHTTDSEEALRRVREHQADLLVVSTALPTLSGFASPSRRGTPGRDALESDRPIALVTPRRVVLVAADEIDWAEAAQTRVVVCAGSKQYPVQETLADFERRLPAGRFIRVRRSMIANVACIQAIQSRGHGELTVTLKGGRKVAVGTTFRDRIERLTRPPLSNG